MNEEKENLREIDEEEIQFNKYVEEYGLWKLGKHPKQDEIGNNFFDHVKLDLEK